MTITSIKYQHASILKLARAGSTKFALSEYRRQGLDKIRDHEDIMAFMYGFIRASFPEDMVRMRTKRILNLLPV